MNNKLDFIDSVWIFFLSYMAIKASVEFSIEHGGMASWISTACGTYVTCRALYHIHKLNRNGN